MNGQRKKINQSTVKKWDFHTVTIKRDLVCQGHVTLSVTYLIFKVTLRVTWPWHTRSRLIVTVWIYIYLTFTTTKTCETKKDHRSSVTSTRVKKDHAQGHVTLTYKIMLDSYSVDLYLFDIRDPKNLRNKKKIIALASLVPELRKVTLRVTWPWRTRSRLIVTVWIYIYLTSATPKTCETKKRSSL